MTKYPGTPHDVVGRWPSKFALTGIPTIREPGNHTIRPSFIIHDDLQYSGAGLIQIIMLKCFCEYDITN